MEQSNVTLISGLNESDIFEQWGQNEDKFCSNPVLGIASFSTCVMVLCIITGAPVNIYTLLKVRRRIYEQGGALWFHGHSLLVIAIIVCLFLAPLRVVDLVATVVHSSELLMVNSYFKMAYTILNPFLYSTSLFTISQQALFHTRLCHNWNIVNFPGFLRYTPWMFGLTFSVLLVAVTYSLHPHQALTDTMLSCLGGKVRTRHLAAWALQAFTNMAMIVVSFLLQVISYYLIVKGQQKHQTRVGVIYHQENMRTSTHQSCVHKEDSVTASLRENKGSMNVKLSIESACGPSTVDPAGIVHRTSACDSYFANCSSSSDSTFMLDLKARMKARLGSDIWENLEEDNSRALPGMVEDEEVIVEKVLGQRDNRSSQQSQMKKNSSGLSSVLKKCSGSERDMSKISIQSQPQMQIYTITENMQQDNSNIPEMNFIRCQSYCSGDYSSENLCVPQSKCSSSTYSLSANSSSLEASQYLSVSASESWSSRSRKLRLRPNSHSLSSSRSLSTSSEMTLPPLKHSRRAPSNSQLVSLLPDDLVCTADAATSTQDLEQTLANCPEEQILTPRAPKITSEAQESDTSILQEAWGQESGSVVMHRLGADHPFFRQNRISQTAAEKVSYWRMSSSTAFENSDMDQPVNESTFFDLCMARQRQYTENSVTSLENICSASQQCQMSVSRPIEINVIRPSNSTNATFVQGTKKLGRKRGVIFQPPTKDLRTVPSSNGSTEILKSKMSKFDVACQAELDEPCYQRRLTYEDTSNTFNIEISMKGTDMDIRGFVRWLTSLIIIYVILLTSAVFSVMVVTSKEMEKRAMLDALVVCKSLTFIWYVVMGPLFVLYNYPLSMRK